MKNILIISGSPRKHGNSDTLCDEFKRGAEEAGHQVEKFFLRDKNIGYCTGCYYCKKSGGVCAINDDMADLLAKMQAADVFVLASPVYFYSLDAQLKTVIDRTVAQWTQLTNKEMYFIMTAAEVSDTVMDCTLECMRGFARCLSGSIERGVIYGKGAWELGDIKTLPAMMEAYDMGRNV